MHILVLNAGSSSFKSSLYRLDKEKLPTDPIAPIWTGKIDWRSADNAILEVKTTLDPIDPRSAEYRRSNPNKTDDIRELLNYLWDGELRAIDRIEEIDIIGHRVVHGGEKYCQPTLINDEVIAEIDLLSTYAPLHNPANLIGIQAISALSPDSKQIAVFDTAFFGDLPEVAYTYPLPYEWLELGIRKYGFHGISHQYCSQRAAQLLGRDLSDLRLISCHLGNGCSLAAIDRGRCIDTTMGFTPLDGLMMGTRCGSIDPGIILHLLREQRYTVAELDRILNFESGLLGVSGVSHDLREIDRQIELGNPRARLALDIYIDRLVANIAALVPKLGSVDAIVFTAGVSEHHPMIRATVAQKLAFLGIEIDRDANNNASIPPDRSLSAPNSAIELLAIHTQEEWQIARVCWEVG